MTERRISSLPTRISACEIESQHRIWFNRRIYNKERKSHRKENFLVTSPPKNDCSLIALARKQLAMAAELVFVYAVLKPADGKKDEVESKLWFYRQWKNAEFNPRSKPAWKSWPPSWSRMNLAASATISSTVQMKTPSLLLKGSELSTGQEKKSD